MRFDVPTHGSAITPPTPVKAKRSRRLRLPKLRMTPTAIIVVCCTVVVLTLTALSGFLYLQHNKLKEKAKTADTADNNNAIVKETIEAVGKLYNLPRGENPTVVTVKDATKLKDQPFFKEAKNDDRVIVFAEAKIAILFRPTANKIINVGPVVTEDPSASTGSQNTDGSTTTNGATTIPGNQ